VSGDSNNNKLIKGPDKGKGQRKLVTKTAKRFDEWMGWFRRLKFNPILGLVPMRMGGKE